MALTILSLLGAFVLSAFVIQAYREAQATNLWPTAPGKIVRAEVQPAFNGHTISITYEYLINDHIYQGERIRLGSPFRFESREIAEDALLDFPEGGEVSVHYDPRDPRRAVIWPGTGDSAARLLSFLPGALLVTIALAWLTWRSWHSEQTGGAGKSHTIERSEAHRASTGWAFPRWSGPFVGTAVGAYIGWRQQRGYGSETMSPMLIGIALGFAGGVVVLLLDGTRRRPSNERPSNRSVDDNSGLVGRFLAVTSILLVWAVFIAPVVGAAAWYLNRRVRGWPRVVSIAGTLISGLLTIVAIVMRIF